MKTDAFQSVSSGNDLNSRVFMILSEHALNKYHLEIQEWNLIMINK